MPQRTPAWAEKSNSIGGSKKGEPAGASQKGKFNQATSKGKQKGKFLFAGKGQGKQYGKKGGKSHGKRGKQAKRRGRKVSPVSKEDQPAFQTKLAERTSRKRLQSPPPGGSSKKTRTENVAIPRAGMPVPPAKFLGNSERMRMHYMKSSAINLEVDFDLHKRTVVVMGRPVQCLQVCHPKAQSFELDGYIPFLVRPVPVQAILGYSSFDKDKPAGSKPHEVVVNWWQVFVFLGVSCHPSMVLKR